ncbi:AraC family transcriptional regulator [Sporosarcina sp. NCCP-2222]|uniref:DJ-1/PfpI family protein n=1 Tax=Sporosarcina sp. NCCP-2222 TaxID=2935073 RepID=UPI00207E75F2|nr:DJ-1/PfpI family protein [Sporosarcina sp. NCCP-2222]GKV55795.1 AraC family transcriptional regulator [Sporosarcina sp. NCCP-2222]
MQFKVGILLFDDVDVLDFAGPYEVFNLTTYNESDVNKLFRNKLKPEDKPFTVCTFSKGGEPIKAHNGLRVSPDYSFVNMPCFDVIVIPGGPISAIKNVSGDSEIINWLSKRSQSELVISVCTGALFLAEANLLEGKRATTHHSAMELLESKYPAIEVVRDSKYVDQGNVITSAGISAGINMALYVVSRLVNEEAAIRTARTIEFETQWTN